MEIGCHVQSKETEAQKGQNLASFQGSNTIPHFTRGNPCFILMPFLLWQKLNRLNGVSTSG